MEENIGLGVVKMQEAVHCPGGVTMEEAAQLVMTMEGYLAEGDPDRVPGIGSGTERERWRGRGTMRGRCDGRKTGRA